MEVDLHGFCENLDHDIMVTLVDKTIDDTRVIALSTAMLKAGYRAGWTCHGTYRGTPQGGVRSPLLATSYLHALDPVVEEMQDKGDPGRTRAIHPEYPLDTARLHNRRTQLQRRLDTGKSHRASGVMRRTRELRA